MAPRYVIKKKVECRQGKANRAWYMKLSKQCNSDKDWDNIVEMVIRPAGILQARVRVFGCVNPEEDLLLAFVEMVISECYGK